MSYQEGTEQVLCFCVACSNSFLLLYFLALVLIFFGRIIDIFGARSLWVSLGGCYHPLCRNKINKKENENHLAVFTVTLSPSKRARFSRSRPFSGLRIKSNHLLVCFSPPSISFILLFYTFLFMVALVVHWSRRHSSYFSAAAATRKTIFCCQVIHNYMWRTLGSWCVVYFDKGNRKEATVVGDFLVSFSNFFLLFSKTVWFLTMAGLSCQFPLCVAVFCTSPVVW